MKTAFEDCDLYGDEASKDLAHTTPEEWIVHTCEAMSDDDLRGLELTCMGFVRKEVSPSHVRLWAKGCAEMVCVGFADDYGCPDHEDGDWRPGGIRALERAFAADIQRVVREHARVWRCEAVAERTYTEEEIRAILREYAGP